MLADKGVYSAILPIIEDALLENHFPMPILAAAIALQYTVLLQFKTILSNVVNSLCHILLSVQVGSIKLTWG